MRTVKIFGDVYTNPETGQSIVNGTIVTETAVETPQVPQALQDELTDFLASTGFGDDTANNWDIVTSKSLEEKKALLKTGVDIISRIEEAVAAPNSNNWNWAKGLVKSIHYLPTDEAVLDVFDETFFKNFMYPG